ncbi:unnamed protein product [Adineta steineri]|uniref:Apple domain-containing protein n=1 Tax=Adineta steineri TaxID=433720 RepID=A0A818J1B2_9BILA|nr:unnamed protein product [Adineta steineri]CAF3533594.1 unnamed protein product [Adineta steineri]
MLISIETQHIPTGWQSFVDFSSSGVEFSPKDINAIFLQEMRVDSTYNCARTCHLMALCRTFDFDIASNRCRIFQGDSATTGSIIPSSSLHSIIGSIALEPIQFTSYGQPCSLCQDSRYLQCINSTCQCQPNTYFDGSICRSQKLLGDVCINETDCRIDRNYTCLPRLQCGPLSLQNGTTVGGYSDGTAGSDNNALSYPDSLAVGMDSSIYVADPGNNRVMRLREGSTTGTIVAGSDSWGSDANQLDYPNGLYVDALANIYVGDSKNYRVMIWRNGSSRGTQVAGAGYYGETLSEIAEILGLTVDSHRNIYIAEKYTHRVTKWAPGARSGILVAGGNDEGPNSDQLSYPGGLSLDEAHSYLYIADSGNNRIQRIVLGGSTNAITVAGGNGAGSNNNQLNSPSDVCFSKNIGAIYIADQYNNRVTRWYIGATSGVTFAGIDSYTGTSPMLFYGPTGLALSLNQSFLYVSDSGNNRVQRFMII